MSNIEILMATMNRNSISDIDWKYKNTKLPVLLINQSHFTSESQIDNVRMISCLERGSSNSRNKALEYSSGEICLIADDDVAYVDDLENIISDAFKKNPSADIITFQIKTPDGSKFNDGYLCKKKWHSWRTILKCASIEIAFRRNSIMSNNLKFDTRFGLGSKYKVHDEIIFLKDALDLGLKILYIPIPIVIHPKESSGTDFTPELIVSKGAAFIRLFGIKGFLFDVFFAIKKHQVYMSQCNFLVFLKKIISGSLKFLKEDMK
ncbi:hypothetical protein A9798_10770 [Edwardsiella hoshinae]|uniref:Glycosyltransferase 2-like domain-containing protein n=1 Tax=Edwardsiella hoshinae TaxID=93378 RepID=A0ABM6EK57_9GAMM|nr:glycosyltransferase [Edwardsiella hoshinae]AOV97389.1 hypothetical protein A9798_10770 [Edwardsiella hoshinae]